MSESLYVPKPEIRFHALYDKIQRMDVFQKAWDIVMKNGGYPSVSRISVENENKDGIEPLLTKIQKKLKTETYKLLPFKRVYIPKSNG